MAARKRKCRHCKTLFRPHPATHHHQKYCSAVECQRARKAENNQDFRRHNPGYFSGPDQVERVRQWRRDHPGYWRNEKRNGGLGRTGANRAVVALQAVPVPQPADHELVSLSHRVDTLQAVSERQLFIMQGLAAQLTGYALQADLGPVLNAWYDRGSRLGGVVPAPVVTGSADGGLRDGTQGTS